MCNKDNLQSCFFCAYYVRYFLIICCFLTYYVISYMYELAIFMIVFWSYAVCINSELFVVINKIHYSITVISRTWFPYCFYRSLVFALKCNIFFQFLNILFFKWHVSIAGICTIQYAVLRFSGFLTFYTFLAFLWGISRFQLAKVTAKAWEVFTKTSAYLAVLWLGAIAGAFLHCGTSPWHLKVGFFRHVCWCWWGTLIIQTYKPTLAIIILCTRAIWDA